MAPRDALQKRPYDLYGLYSSDDIDNLHGKRCYGKLQDFLDVFHLHGCLRQMLLISNILLRPVVSRDADIQRNGQTDHNENQTLGKHAPAAEFLGSLDSGGRLLGWVGRAGNGDIGDDELVVFVCSAQTPFCTAVDGSSWIETKTSSALLYQSGKKRCEVEALIVLCGRKYMTMRKIILQIDAFPVHDGDLHTAYRNLTSLEFNMNTFRGHLQLSALGDLDGLDGSVGLGLDLLDLLNDIKALEDFAEDDVTPIEPPIAMLASVNLVLQV
jgi:hypothetical protein